MLNGFANKITRNIWLGDYQSSVNKRFLNDNDIKIVINCAEEIPFNNYDYNVYDRKIISYKLHCIDDLSIKQNKIMYTYLNKILKIIDFYNKNNYHILIHCAMGIQRSAIIVLSYLYEYCIKKHNPIYAYNYLKQKRNVVFPFSINFKLAFCKRYNLDMNSLP